MTSREKPKYWNQDLLFTTNLTCTSFELNLGIPVIASNLLKSGMLFLFS
jgi:hypothetical protein